MRAPGSASPDCVFKCCFGIRWPGPWVLGVSSGAGFGLMTATWMSLTGGILGGVGGLLLAFAGMPAAALGALLAIGVVWDVVTPAWNF